MGSVVPLGTLLVLPVFSFAPALTYAVDGDDPPALTEALLLEAEGQARSGRAEDKKRAIEAIESALRESKDHEISIEARALVDLGDFHRELGRAREALAFYDRALDRASESAWVQVRAHAGAGLALLRLDDYEEGLRRARLALEASERTGNDRLRARALTTLGTAYYDSRRLEDSLGTLREALGIWRRLGERRGQAEALIHQGFARSDLGEEWAALRLHRQALALAQEATDRTLEALALMGLGNAFAKIGEHQSALVKYHEAAPILEEIGDLYWRAGLDAAIGYLYSEVADYTSAKVYFERALRVNDAIASLTGQAGNLVHLGRIEHARREENEALRLFEIARARARVLGKEGVESVVLHDIAASHLALGNETKALSFLERSLALSREHGLERQEAEGLLLLGKIEMRRGENGIALGRFRRALTLNREISNPFGEVKSLAGIARVERASGNLEDALEASEEALRLVESLRGKIASYSLRASFLASIYDLNELHVDLLMELDGKHPGLGFDRRAFVAAESARARSLLEMLSQGRQRATGQADAELSDYESRLVAAIRKQAASAAGGTSPALLELLAELDRVRALLRNGDPRNPLAEEASFVTVEDVQRKLLEPGTALLAYFLTERASYLWVISKSSFSAHRLPPRAEVENLAREIHDLLESRSRGFPGTAKQKHDRLQEGDSRYWTLASSLSRSLLGDALRDLDAGRLVIVGDGMLHQIPFSALPCPSTNGTPLVMRYEIVRLPSASALRVLERRTPGPWETRKRIAVVADPVFDDGDPRVGSTRGGEPESVLPKRNRGAALFLTEAQVRALSRLPSTRIEARGILELVPPGERFEAVGFGANRALVESGELARYEVVHFATHGILNTEHPELTGIVLSLVDRNGRPQDGFVRLHEIYGLSFPVRLVVLSACSTALGKAVRGEGLVGLSAGFLSAGASGVIASYWDVDDEATSELMKRFYGKLFSERLTPSSALRAAQTSMWLEKRWHFPFYWGAFEFQGDWK